MARPAVAEINLDNLRHNYQLANSLVGDAQVIAVVKANAYGHGAVAVSKALQDLAPAFAVACIEEALELRRGGITQPVLLLEGAFSEDEVIIASVENFWLMVDNHKQISMLQNVTLQQSVSVWIKVDTGMHRLGFQLDEVADVYGELQSLSAVNDDIVVASHFACADDVSNEMTQAQTECLRNTVKPLPNNESILLSLGNSAAILGWPEAQGDWVRPGIMLYGCSPFIHAHDEAKRLKPVMTLKSQVIAVRDVVAGEAVGYGATWTANRTSKIATVAIGYGDGYPRTVPSGTPVLVNGERCLLAGRVSMDMITVDVTDLEDVEIGDEVMLWGEGLPCEEIAGQVDTISYELLTRIPTRVSRMYFEEIEE
ncbi:MAG: alanine racemase [Cellvibrionaceae bacterium]